MNYILRRSTRARHMRITVQKDHSVVVTLPTQMNSEKAHKFVEEKKKWIEHAIKKLERRPSAAPDFPRASKEHYLANKKKTLELVNERLKHFNQAYDYTWNSVSIRNTTSRWGSCSRKGNLNFNYRLLFLPKKLADYVIVHELCHLEEFNHSADFWKLVEQTIPDYQSRRKQLQSI